VLCCDFSGDIFGAGCLKPRSKREGTILLVNEHCTGVIKQSTLGTERSGFNSSKSQ
jgi:hypothetical protein